MEIDTLGIMWEYLFGGGHKNVSTHLSNLSAQQYGVWGIILLSLLPKIKTWGDQIINYITRRKK